MRIERPETISLCLFLLLAALYLVCAVINFDCMSRIAILRLMPPLAAAGASALTKIVLGNRSGRVIMFVISVWAVVEMCLGMLQMAGITESGSHFFAVSGSFQNPNPYAALLAGWGCMLICTYRMNSNIRLGKVCLAASVPTFSMVLSLGCRGAYLAALAGLCVAFGLKNTLKRLARHWLVWILAALVLSSGLYLWKKQSADGRMQLYSLCVRAICKSPVTGCGPGHFQRTVSMEQAACFEPSVTVENGIPAIRNVDMPRIHRSQAITSAFCDPLQLGVELGCSGMIGLLGLMFSVILSLCRFCRPLAAMACVLAVTSLFSYTFAVWKFGLLGGVLTGQAMPCRKDRHASGLIAWAVPGLVAAVWFLSAGVGIQKNWKGWQKERCLLDLGEYEAFVRCESNRYNILCFDKEFLNDLAFALSSGGDIGRSDSILQTGYAMTGNPSFMLQMGDNCMLRGKTTAARELYFKAFMALPDRLLPLVRIAETYFHESDTARLEAMKIMVGGFHTHVETGLADKLRNELEQMVLDNENYMCKTPEQAVMDMGAGSAVILCD